MVPAFLLCLELLPMALEKQRKRKKEKERKRKKELKSLVVSTYSS
jgi:hypothetical protein